MQVKQPNKILTMTKKQRQEPKVGKKSWQEGNGELDNSKGKFNQMQRNSVRNCLRV